MAHRTSKGGSYRIDKVLRGFGRIAMASGATTLAGLRKRKDLLDRLYDKGRVDLLQSIRDGTLTLTEVLDADRRDALGSLTGLERVLALPLWETVENWTPKARKGRRAPKPVTVKRYKVAFRSLRRKGPLGPKARVGGLFKVDWGQLEQAWGGSSADWNHLRRTVSRFLSDMLGVHHQKRIELMEDFPLRDEQDRVTDITPEVFWKIVDAMPEHVQAAYVAIVVMALDTGEYLALTKDDLLFHRCAVLAPGGKNSHRTEEVLRVPKAYWPWITRAVPAPVQYQWLRKYWKRALQSVDGANETWRLKDLRHCYAQWLTDEGQSEARVAVGMRHADPSMTRRYAKQRDRGENAEVMGDILDRARKVA